MQKFQITKLRSTSKTLSKKPLRTKTYCLHITQQFSLLRSFFHFFYSCLLVIAKAVLALCLFVPFVQANNVWESERAVYKKALTALNKQQINQFHQYSIQLKDYPLYQYLVYAELRSRISRLSNQEVDAFLTEYNDGPLATRLRVAWLYQLLRKEHTESFLKYYQGELASELQCFFLDSKIKNGEFEKNKKQYLRQIQDIWLVGKSQPKQCDGLFHWFEKQGYLTNALVWERFSMAMDNNNPGLAKYLMHKLNKSEHPQAKLWLDIHHNPKAKLETKPLRADKHLNRKIIRHGIIRLARQDLSKAHEVWMRIKDNYAFGSELHDEVERNLALRAAYRHDHRATTWMYQLPKDLVDPSTSMWRARAALRSLDWDLVLRGIAMLTEEEKAEEQWQYWKARALGEKGLRSDAIAIYEKIATERSYYGFLAADRISKPYNIIDAPVQYDATDLESLEQNPSILRARELLLVNQISDARREWNYATENFSEKQLQIAAALAHQWQWHDYAIFTIAKGRYFDDLNIRFPTPFTNYVQKYSSKRSLEPAFIFGIIRRESAFNPQAISPVGARGLMQLMPATAKQVSQQLKLKPPTRHDLYSPSFNINLGSRYIRDMLNKFNGHRALASAAYNAGPHRVNAWLPEEHELPADVWVDTIPFTETREYVRAILAYTAMFEWKLNQNPTRLSVHLQPVPPNPRS